MAKQWTPEQVRGGGRNFVDLGLMAGGALAWTDAPFVPLPRLAGRLSYRRRSDGRVWGDERWTITRGADGLRTLSAHCEMRLGDEQVVRDSVLSVHPDYHPHDAYVRIMRGGRVTGWAAYRFTDTWVECEGWGDEGRVSQTMPLTRPTRSFGVHAVQSDGWLAGPFPYERGAGHRHFFGRNLLHSDHHLGATGPRLAVTGSGLEYVGPETIDVPAGRFDCHRVRFVGLTNAHPPYDMWITRDDFVYARGVVEGYMDSEFLLEELEPSDPALSLSPSKADGSTLRQAQGERTVGNAASLAEGRA